MGNDDILVGPQKFRGPFEGPLKTSISKVEGLGQGQGYGLGLGLGLGR